MHVRRTDPRIYTVALCSTVADGPIKAKEAKWRFKPPAGNSRVA